MRMMEFLMLLMVPADKTVQMRKSKLVKDIRTEWSGIEGGI